MHKNFKHLNNFDKPENFLPTNDISKVPLITFVAKYFDHSNSKLLLDRLVLTAYVTFSLARALLSNSGISCVTVKHWWVRGCQTVTVDRCFTVKQWRSQDFCEKGGICIKSKLK